MREWIPDPNLYNRLSPFWKKLLSDECAKKNAIERRERERERWERMDPWAKAILLSYGKIKAPKEGE